MRMMYKSGKQTTICGLRVDYQIVEDYEIEAYLELGWVKHPLDLIKSEPEPVEVTPVIEAGVEEIPEVVTEITKPKKASKRGKKA